MQPGWKLIGLHAGSISPSIRNSILYMKLSISLVVCVVVKQNTTQTYLGHLCISLKSCKFSFDLLLNENAFIQLYLCNKKVHSFFFIILLQPLK